MDTPIQDSAQDFAVLDASMATYTGPTAVTEDPGTFPGASGTDLGSIMPNGSEYQSDAMAQQAQRDVTTVYNIMADIPTPVANDLTGSIQDNEVEDV